MAIKAKSRPQTRFDKLMISWQWCQLLKITFDELEKIDVQETRELLDGSAES